MSAIMEHLRPRLGGEISVSDWLLVDQAMIDAFAACTGDHQWIHVDVARAQAGPFGATIAHGYLTLSLIPVLTGQSWLDGIAVDNVLNYGLERVRFLAPVRAGCRVRNRLKLISLEDKGGGRVLVGFENTVEIDGETRPALIASTLAMAFGPV